MAKISPTIQSDVTEVMPGVIVVPCPLPPSYTKVVSMVVVKSQRLAIIDTGITEFMPAAIEPGMSYLGCKLSDVDIIINTHGHWDHVQGNALIKAASNASICIAAADAHMLETPPDRILKEGDEVDLGRGMVFEVIVTPGHTKGSICLYDHSTELLIASDSVQGPGAGEYGSLPVYFDSGTAYRESLKKLLKLNLSFLVLGHPLYWSGIPHFVHRGNDTRKFLHESLIASQKIEQAINNALVSLNDPNFDQIKLETLKVLEQDPLFLGFTSKKNLTPGANETIRSELRDLGKNFSN